MGEACSVSLSLSPYLCLSLHVSMSVFLSISAWQCPLWLCRLVCLCVCLSEQKQFPRGWSKVQCLALLFICPWPLSEELGANADSASNYSLLMSTLGTMQVMVQVLWSLRETWIQFWARHWLLGCHLDIESRDVCINKCNKIIDFLC